MSSFGTSGTGGYKFTQPAAAKIVQAVKVVLSTPNDQRGRRGPFRDDSGDSLPAGQARQVLQKDDNLNNVFDWLQSP